MPSCHASICFCRAAAVPISTSQGRSGANFAASPRQFSWSEAGQTTSAQTARPCSISRSSSANVCTVLPRPMSSARMPPKPASLSALSHDSPVF